MMPSVANKYAIVIGVSIYEDSEIGSLLYAADDARRLADVLKVKAGVDSSRLYLMCADKQEFGGGIRRPTRVNILETLTQVVQQADDQSEILFFYSGHGCEIEKKPYLLTTDSQSNSLDKTALDVDNDINEILKKSKAKFIFRIFDACRAGDQIGKTLTSEKMTQGLQNAFFHKADVWATISSCSSGETSLEYPGRKQGVFSYFLCEGLNGKAADNRGRVTLNSLFDYLSREVQQWAKRNAKMQTPHFLADISGYWEISAAPAEQEILIKPSSFRMQIQDILEHLPFDKLAALKKLFWTELNYDKAFNEPLSIHDWPVSVKANLADTTIPRLFAQAGSQGGFHVIYCQLSTGLNLTTERQIASQLLPKHPYGLFIFSDEAQVNWHFANVKHTSGKNEKRRIFRRITIGPNESLRTATERLSLLDLKDLDGNGLAPIAIQRLHDEAFDVEKVTEAFFLIYKKIFEKAEATITKDWTPGQKRLYTQRFFNRLMFLAFLERKGWLTFNGRRDYLRALFEDYWRNDPEKRREANFHRKRLNTLFFMGLNYPGGDKRGETEYRPILSLIGDVPYLNGGLFEQEADDETVFFPDEIVASILKDLIYAFNFTVTESTPLDVEVAVDPEMLGKIFEELVTGRHETGSYYTPKPVVSFMCREALKGYLHNSLRTESEAAIIGLIDENDSELIQNPLATLHALESIKVCDPACGSGAYLLGMLHELMETRISLLRTKKLTPKTDYQYKNEIIQNSLYGVDKDDFAVNIARLRLWLSLIVDFEGTTPPPLPNLKYKIETGDSLTSPDPSGGLETGFRKQQIDDLLNAKNEYITAHDARKKELEQEIETLKAGIRAWSGIELTNTEDTPEWLRDRFDWAIEFAEIFVKQERGVGFDVVLANPPYVRADAQFKHIRDEAERQAQITRWQVFRTQLKLAKIYKETLHEKWDLYIPFLERAHQLLHDRGQMVFIIPDSYNAAKYANKSHDFFLRNSRVMRIDFCSEINLFDAGVNNTILHFEKGEPPINHQPVRARRWGNRDEFDENIQTLVSNPQLKLGEPLFKLDEATNQQSQGFISLQQIVYISYGLAVSSDEKKFKGEFVTEDVVSLVKDKHHPKLFVEGKDLTRWWIKRIRYLEWGTDRAPAKFRRQTFPELLDASEKLISLVVASGGPPVVYDDKKFYTTHTSCIFVPWYLLKGVVNKSINKTAKYHHQDPLGDREKREETSRQFNLKYVLAIMNSDVANQWLKNKVRSKNHIYPDDWKQLPIAPISLEAQQPFVEKVEAILGEYKRHGHPLPLEAAQRVQTLERELDEMVGKLYEG
jgi:type I restriction-modification system DNA methylase subunit